MTNEGRLMITGVVAGLVSAVAAIGAVSMLDKGAVGGIDQANVCEVSDVSLAATNDACEPGQKVAFLPGKFGNEQLPVLFAAVNCDHRYEIAMTKGGVSCIFNPMKSSSGEEQETQEQ